MTMSIRGYAAQSATTPLAAHQFERRDARANDVVIDILYCGVCHSDIHQARDEWGGSIFPMVPGHEIAGIVRAVGPKVTKYKVGDQVGVGCFVDSCRHCSSCQSGLNQYCLEGITLTYNGYEKDGKTISQGGYSNVIVVDENYVLRIPNGMPLDKAAPLLCAGITLYSPLRHWKAGPGKKVAIAGLGGLGHMGVKIARALGADVTVLSQSDRKREDALRMGAHHFLSTRDKKVFAEYANHFDLIVNTVSAGLEMGDYFGLLKVDGALVAVGMPDQALTFHPAPLVSKRRTYAGSMIGSIGETQEMLDFCAQHEITPDIEVIPPANINAAFERVMKSDVRYRFVIDLRK